MFEGFYDRSYDSHFSTMPIFYFTFFHIYNYTDNIVHIPHGAGTRIIYDRDFLMQCRHSPLALSPPANLPHIPGVTEPANHILAPAGQENPSAPPSGPGCAAGRNGIIAPKQQHPGSFKSYFIQ